MKYCLYILALIFISSCKNAIEKDALYKLNGYWEITEVIFSDGQKKTYTVNPTVDFIELEKMKGYKKKVHPKFDGSYDTSNDAESFTILKENDTFIFLYKNTLSEWQEQLIRLEENTFAIINEDNITYTYKRFEPITIE